MSAEDVDVEVLKQRQAVQVYVLAMCQMFEIDVYDVYRLFSVSDRITFTDEDIASLIDESPSPSEQKLPPFSPIVIEGGFRGRSRLNLKLFIIIALVVILQIDAGRWDDSRKAVPTPTFVPSSATASATFVPTPSATASATFVPSATASAAPLGKSVTYWDKLFYRANNTLDYSNEGSKAFTIIQFIKQEIGIIIFIASSAYNFLGFLYTVESIILFMILYLQNNNNDFVRPLLITGTAVPFLLFYKYLVDMDRLLPPISEDQEKLLTARQVDLSTYKTPQIWNVGDLDDRILRLNFLLEKLKEDNGVVPAVAAAGAGAALVQYVPPGAGAVRQRRPSVKIQNNNRNLIFLVERFIKKCQQIRNDIKINPIFIGPNYLRSIESLQEGVKWSIAPFVLGIGAQVAQGLRKGNNNITLARLGGGESYFCWGLSHLVASVTTILVLLLIVVLVATAISYGIESTENSSINNPPFWNRITSVAEIKETFRQIIQFIFVGNNIYDHIYLLAERLQEIILEQSMLYLIFESSSILILIEFVKAFKIIDIIYFIVNLGYNLLGLRWFQSMLQSGLDPNNLNKMRILIYESVSKKCGNYNFKKKEDIVKIVELGIKVLVENIPKVPAADTLIKEENKLILTSLKPIVLDKTKLRIDPKLYTNLQRFKPSRSQPSRKRTASRPSRKRRTASRPSRSRPSRSRTSPRRVKKTSRARAKSKRSRR